MNRENYGLEEREISGRRCFLLPKDISDKELAAVNEKFGFGSVNTDGFVRAAEENPDVPLRVAIVDTGCKRPVFLPAFCLFWDGEYHLVCFAKGWLCLNRNLHGGRDISTGRVLMPLFECEPDYYIDRRFPPLPDFFVKVRCPVCGRYFGNHMYLLDGTVNS